MQQNNKELKTIVQDVLSYGDMLLIANEGVRKTNSLMVLAREFKEMENTRIIIFKDFPRMIRECNAIAYMVINDNDVCETQHIVDMENYLFKA